MRTSLAIMALIATVSAQCDDAGVDSFGDGCEWYDENPDSCGNYDTDDWSSWDSCCACAFCENDTFADTFGDGCDWYDENPDGCGNYDAEDGSCTSLDSCYACWE